MSQFNKTIHDTNQQNAQNRSLPTYYYNITLNNLTCFDPQWIIIRESNQKNIVYNQISHVYTQLSCYAYNLATLFLCGTVLFSFPDEDPLRIETCKDIQCDII